MQLSVNCIEGNKGRTSIFQEGREVGGGGAEKLSLENMSLKHIQSTPGNSNETFKGNKQRFEFSETREK